MKEVKSTKNHTHPAGAGLTVKRIDKLLALLRELVKRLELEPRKDPERWDRFVDEASREFPDLSKERSAQAIGRAGRKNLKRIEFRKLTHSEYWSAFGGGIVALAEKKYRSSDPEYARVRQNYEDKVWELLKKINHHLSPLREELCKFSQTEGSLLRVDWGDIRDELTVPDLAFALRPLVSKAVDVLKAIRVEVEWQRPEPVGTQHDGQEPKPEKRGGGVLNNQARDLLGHEEATDEDDTPPISPVPIGVGKRALGEREASEGPDEETQKKPGTDSGDARSDKEERLAKIEPMKLEGRWNIPGGSLEKLKRIDSNPKGDGIRGTKKEKNRLKYYLKKHRKRPDIAETLYCEDSRIKTEMACGRMFSQE